MKAKYFMITGLSMLFLSSVAVFANNAIVPTSISTTAKTVTQKGMNMKGMHVMGRKFMGKGGRGPGFAMNTEAKAALDANDYTKFVNATKGTKLEGKVTQAQFDDMADQKRKNEAKKTAIANNDYASFVKASTPTQADFEKIVAGYKTKLAIDAALKNNDFVAFQAAVNVLPMRDKTITQEEFTKMVEHFKNQSDNAEEGLGIMEDFMVHRNR